MHIRGVDEYHSQRTFHARADPCGGLLPARPQFRGGCLHHHGHGDECLRQQRDRPRHRVPHSGLHLAVDRVTAGRQGRQGRQEKHFTQNKARSMRALPGWEGLRGGRALPPSLFRSLPVLVLISWRSWRLGVSEFFIREFQRSARRLMQHPCASCHCSQTTPNHDRLQATSLGEYDQQSSGLCQLLQAVSVHR